MYVKSVIWLWIVLLGVSPGSFPGLSAEGEGDEPPGDQEMTTYQFVLLHRGPERDPIGERETQRLQETHLALMSRLLDEGKAVILGPLSGAGDLRRVVVLDVGSVERAEAILRQDPWISSGRLTAEIHPWWTAKGVLRKPAHHLHMTRCILGLFRRPAGAPDYSPQRLAEIQAGHLENIRRMQDSGDLVLAGPFTDDGTLRGVLVFRTQDTERIRELVAGDPAIAAGRLGLELYPWSVPVGSLPER